MFHDHVELEPGQHGGSPGLGYPDALSAFLQEYLQAAACQDCEVRPVCGGCLAVAYGYGLDIFRGLDPCCWKEDRKTRVHCKKNEQGVEKNAS